MRFAVLAAGAGAGECFRPDTSEQALCCQDGGYPDCFDEEYTFERCCSSFPRLPPDPLLEAVRRLAFAQVDLWDRPKAWAQLLLGLGALRDARWAEVGVQRGEFGSGLMHALGAPPPPRERGPLYSSKVVRSALPMYCFRLLFDIQTRFQR